MRKDLPRLFGLPTATFTVVASMVGAGILTNSGFILRDTGNYAVVLGLWAVGGAVALCGALTVAEMAAAMPRAGGEYVYLREAYGPIVAFVSGWTSFIAGFSAALALIANVSATYLLAPLYPSGGDVPELPVLILATGLIVFFTGAHMVGHRTSGRIQVATTLAKVGLLAGYVVLGLTFGDGSFQHLTEGRPVGGSGWSTLAFSLVYVLYGYAGWNASTYIAGEVRDAPRLLPRSLVTGCVFVMALYLALNLVYAFALPPEFLGGKSEAEVKAIALIAAEKMFGTGVWKVLSGMIGLSLVASVSAYILTGPRVYFAMASDGLFPSFAARTSPRWQTPTLSIAAQSAVALVFLWTGSFETILAYAGFALALVSMAIIAAAIVLRIRRPDLPRPFKTPGYPWVPLLFLGVSLWMVVFSFMDTDNLKRPLISASVVLAGIPMYFLWKGCSGGFFRSFFKTGWPPRKGLK